ncbi:MAG: hypothetical protein KGO49_09330 [Gammaproteobacteria bacterium]|nr:hypothetical protein [Gammaproteobacteria bacterium]
MAPEIYNQYVIEAQRQGFDTSKLIITPQK